MRRGRRRTRDRKCKDQAAGLRKNRKQDASLIYVVYGSCPREVKKIYKTANN